jgi:G3E family GTPase
VLVGGFLGAGKTTLILAAARELERRGMRSAVILNDQGDSLVDTQYAALGGLHAGEVTGGCFCCRLADLLGAMEAMRSFAPHVIFAEPVGSCTDISATVVHPLLEQYADYRIAPLTVLVDPAQAAALSGPASDPNMAFLFDKQLAEADLVCLTKSDLEGNLEATPSVLNRPHLQRPAIRRVSALRGDGIAAWLDEILSGQSQPGATTLDIDYQRYAEAEAALAWLNLDAHLNSGEALTPAQMAGPLIDHLDREFTRAGIAIVHLKALIRSDAGFLKLAVTRNGQEPDVRGDLSASSTRGFDLTLNLRAVGDPDIVRGIVEIALASSVGTWTGLRLRCFQPAPPQPERRIPALR